MHWSCSHSQHSPLIVCGALHARPRTGVAFAVAAAAEAAMARALNLPAGSVSISEQYLVRRRSRGCWMQPVCITQRIAHCFCHCLLQGFCPAEKGSVKFCQSPWDLLSALNKLQKEQASLLTRDCLPYTAPTNDDPSTYCKCVGAVELLLGRVCARVPHHDTHTVTHTCALP